MSALERVVLERAADSPVPTTGRGKVVECDHTLHLVDATGRACGSWEGNKTPAGIRYSCGCCGRFYGYAPKPSSDAARFAN